MFHQFTGWLAASVGQWGYPGIVLLMALESSFFPFPSEIVIPPAAYLAATGKMNLIMVIICGITGSLVGAVFNYWLALKLGRPFFEKYGMYLLINRKSLEKADRFFERHGHISTFIGRLLPGIRQYISLPAGLARMNISSFCAATALGAGIWVAILAALGYLLGRNEDVIIHNLHWISLAIIIICAILILLYIYGWKKRITDLSKKDK